MNARTPPSRTRIKICGLRTIEQVDAAVAAGADAIGFVLYPPSIRAVDLALLRRLTERVPAMVSTVALFVNPTGNEVLATLEAARIDLIQFHGSAEKESETFCGSFGRPYMKAFAVDDGFNLLESVNQYTSANALLLDTPSAGHGGSGKTFNWQLINTQNMPSAHAPALVLSGGLTPANVGDAISVVKPFAVDVSSGVEISRGEKSIELIHQFCHAVRAADSQNAT
ncbi:MAG: phosphoribosylanthranilate isomerase [Betaproteobacteria bacterium]|nr:MAG: phosphoribosylanthranilate isomerase [Betaproteobacteria bacterium]